MERELLATTTTTSPPGVRLPRMAIVEGRGVLLHEECDPKRVERLSERLQQDGFLKNPPIATPLDRLPGPLVVLDGANRVMALSNLGYPYQLVQIVDYFDPAITLDVWRHLLLDIPGVELIERIAGAVGTRIERVPPEEAQARLRRGEILCAVTLPGGASYTVGQASDLLSNVELLARVVEVYKYTARIYRVQGDDLAALSQEYGGAEALVSFPPFTKEEILAIAQNGAKLPTGITRHVIPGRALRVNLPLELLEGSAPVDQANSRLQELIREKLRDHRVRFYPEATVLFDE
jgi:hypothetical protein